ncbi:glycosyltransferase family 4 protein [Flavobacterium terrigena]|uniref:Glycosyltransferase involved in cell wall bisynthesis n=1 Tax=Flavobacterium terrigena TaxID=402734 RepID=A0A1H6TRA0_9FLAO|nr:glycosyltransferase family 4 protein [Flavobacterium terrigena]SEI79737.1 Glycosyltransferase involved in cell wall bisynthesis [Flavobacterium terrigena]
MKNVLIINQSSELYGADKALLELIDNFPKNFTPIVVLENEGPLKEILLQKGIKVIKCPVVKLNRSLLSFYGIYRVFVDSIRGFYIISKETKTITIDLVHSNAISVLIGAFYSLFYNKPHLWHVHEIVESPKTIAKLYPRIVNFFSDKIIYNSKASYNQFLKIYPKVEKKSEVIYNGQSRNFPISDKTLITVLKETVLKTQQEAIVIGLVGRISRWKGQYLLLEAFDKLIKKHSNIHLVFVGSTPPGQDHFLVKLNDLIASFKLEKNVTIVDFQKNIWQIYDAIDISVVPSIEPEPFGLVATEAMLSNKPVIAAKHGGLCEIVVDNETGLFFEPRNVDDLAKKLEILVLNPDLREKYGNNGNKRVKDVFSTEQYVSSFEKKYIELTS